MVQPLALVVHEKLLPGSQLANRLQDLNYRVRTLADTAALVACAEQEKPMLVLADLTSSRHNVPDALRQLRSNPATRHIPVIAFCPDQAPELQHSAEAAGASLIASETAILAHLHQFLEQALRVE